MITLQRDPDGEPGTWRPHQLAGGRITATIFCPACGRPGTLEDHVILDSGEVTPSIVCPHGCGFHDFGHLAGWNGRQIVEA